MFPKIERPDGFYDSVTGERIHEAPDPNKKSVISDGRYGYTNFNGERVEFTVVNGKIIEPPTS